MVVETARGTYLDRILDNTARELAERKAARPLADVDRAARGQPAPATLAPALRGSGVTVIAEVKRASPSKGPIAPQADAAAVAREYITGGAAAISVLTDATFFNGSLNDLRAVADVARASSPSRPVLRKDFVIDPYQVVEARASGADAVLIIVAALSDALLAELLAAARDYGLSVLTEVHDERELERALSHGVELIGVNNRDLRSFTVDLAVTERLSRRVPANVTLVGESGIRSRADAERLGRAGVHAVLVGESLMTAPDRAAAVRELVG